MTVRNTSNRNSRYFVSNVVPAHLAGVKNFYIGKINLRIDDLMLIFKNQILGMALSRQRLSVLKVDLQMNFNPEEEEQFRLESCECYYINYDCGAIYSCLSTKQTGNAPDKMLGNNVDRKIIPIPDYCNSHWHSISFPK